MISDLAYGSGSLVAQHVLVGALARYAGPLADPSSVLFKLLVSNTVAYVAGYAGRAGQGSMILLKPWSHMKPPFGITWGSPSPDPDSCLTRTP